MAQGMAGTKSCINILRQFKKCREYFSMKQIKVGNKAINKIIEVLINVVNHR